MASPGPPPRATGRLRAALRHNVLIGISTLVFLALGVANTALLDNAGLSGEKREILRRHLEGGTILPLPTLQTLDLRAIGFLNAATPEQLVLRREELEQAFDTVLESFPSIVEISLTRSGEPLVSRSVPGRMRANNDWSISLFARESRLISTRPVLPGPNAQGGGVARLTVTVTVPPRDKRPAEMQAELRTLVARYRRYALTLWTVLAAGYGLVLVGLLLPVRRVVQTLDNPQGTQPPIIRRPRSLLERAYNQVASDAAVARLARELREKPDAPGPAADPDAILGAACRLAAQATGTDGFQLVILAPGKGSQRLHAVAVHSQPDVAWLPGRTFAEALGSFLGEEQPREGSRAFRWTDERGRTRHAAVATINESPQSLQVLVLHSNPLATAPPTTWELDLLGRLAREVRFALADADLRRRLILQEKSKANISLSRNLGHDLTNIIATAKLELMTVASFLRLDPAQIAAAPHKAAIYRESLGALLNSIRFMQEVVNLYRSFSYLQRPKFERVAPAGLAQDVVELFRLSVSGNFPTTCEAAPNLPEIEVEPRLLRLALFNLMTNAVEAMRRASSTGTPEGLLRVRVLRDGHDAVLFVVEDSGPGIRNAEGRLLEPDEISMIFRLGYTTKGEGEGEGLGLAWVQTIVTEFHNGELRAANRPEGGAEFLLRLPIRKDSGTSSSEMAALPPPDTNNPTERTG